MCAAEFARLNELGLIVAHDIAHNQRIWKQMKTSKPVGEPVQGGAQLCSLTRSLQLPYQHSGTAFEARPPTLEALPVDLPLCILEILCAAVLPAVNTYGVLFTDGARMKSSRSTSYSTNYGYKITDCLFASLCGMNICARQHTCCVA